MGVSGEAAGREAGTERYFIFLQIKNVFVWEKSNIAYIKCECIDCGPRKMLHL